MKMLSLALAAALALGATAAQAQNLKLRAAGNLVATGLIQQTKEQPFFENFAKNTGSMPAAWMMGNTTGSVPTIIGIVSRATPRMMYITASTQSSATGDTSSALIMLASDCGTPSIDSTKFRYSAATRISAVMAVSRSVERKHSCSMATESFP